MFKVYAHVSVLQTRWNESCDHMHIQSPLDVAEGRLLQSIFKGSLPIV